MVIKFLEYELEILYIEEKLKNARTIKDNNEKKDYTIKQSWYLPGLWQSTIPCKNVQLPLSV